MLFQQSGILPELFFYDFVVTPLAITPREDRAVCVERTLAKAFIRKCCWIKN